MSLAKLVHKIKYGKSKPPAGLYSYRPERDPDSFVSRYPQTIEKRKDRVAQTVYAFWTGSNPMSENRQKHFQLLKANIGVDLILVTPDNLPQYILPDHPLHPAFSHLSLVHKADYLRCYFMHNHGGGYTDIKACRHNWRPLFARLNKSRDYLIGYPESGVYDLAPVDGTTGADMRTHYRHIIGNGAYICRKNTPFTREWYEELLNRMDGYADALQRHPGNIMGDNPGYPIAWTAVLGDIFHPLSLKYMHQILRSDKLKPMLTDYR